MQICLQIVVSTNKQTTSGSYRYMHSKKATGVFNRTRALCNLTHWPLGDKDVILNEEFSNSFQGYISWAYPVKLSCSKCYKTSLMISQHWFRFGCAKWSGAGWGFCDGCGGGGWSSCTGQIVPSEAYGMFSTWVVGSEKELTKRVYSRI